ncbi:mycothiol transferase [Actinoplanes friuliensis]|jgi:hypothetical protein|uniref:Mini-circle protein n=1 Tax=Actinoplanes friuliensis DSM 7358 TaxID=1246995 RepID=U5VZ94_9ACTN|nr:DUF664 domain-containing protein [Actinoplanes friuliensis]AGZ42072.1 hypothetical protein AFR_18990 [Actinoplanes friuliensis DSM 7358]
MDTTITEPSMTAGEAEMLLFALERSRATFAWKTGGLDAAALSRTFPPSTMTIGGLVKHLAAVEEKYTNLFFSADPVLPDWFPPDLGADPQWEWTTAADHSPEELYAIWESAVEKSREVLTALLADGGPGRASYYDTGTGESPNLRRALVDLHDEYARHVGHADLFREAIDGVVGEDPPQG